MLKTRIDSHVIPYPDPEQREEKGEEPAVVVAFVLSSHPAARPMLGGFPLPPTIRQKQARGALA
jgi:hypothetical protein